MDCNTFIIVSYCVVVECDRAFYQRTGLCCLFDSSGHRGGIPVFASRSRARNQNFAVKKGGVCPGVAIEGDTDRLHRASDGCKMRVVSRRSFPSNTQRSGALVTLNIGAQLFGQFGIEFFQNCQMLFGLFNFAQAKQRFTHVFVRLG